MRLPGGDDNFLHDNLIGSQQNMPGKITCNPDGVGISFITDKTDFQFIFPVDGDVLFSIADGKVIDILCQADCRQKKGFMIDRIAHCNPDGECILSCVLTGQIISQNKNQNDCP